MRAAAHHALAVAMAALALLVCVEGANDLGLSFNETMAGFYTAGDLDFQQAYDQGKASGRNMHFTCHVTIPHMQQFVADPDHASKIDGVIFITELTNFPGVTFQGGVLNVFNRSVDFQELEMAYFIPFVGLDGNQYHLEGLKHIRGAECIHLLAMSTTLYSHVRKGWVDGEGDIISTGIVIIDIIRVIELVESMRVVGNGTDADKLDMFFNFASFLLSQVSKDCLNSTNWESQFWYIWGSDGSNGFLLDMVARPDTLELRLETYIKDQTPVVTKQYLNVEQLSVFAHGAVSFGNVLTMSETGCQGSVGNLSVNATYDVTYATNDFVPIILYAALQGLLPEIESKYGVLTGAAKIGNVTLAASTPLVHTTYTFKVGLKLMQWCMISAMQFVGTDLKVEAIGMYIPDAGFLGTAFVHYNGKQYQLNDPVTAAVSVVANGSAIVNNTRTVTFTIVYKHEVNLEVQCSAPASAFALLDKEGNTEIHTTVLGQCRAVDNVGALAFNSVPSALMEIKQTA